MYVLLFHVFPLGVDAVDTVSARCIIVGRNGSELSDGTDLGLMLFLLLHVTLCARTLCEWMSDVCASTLFSCHGRGRGP